MSYYVYLSGYFFIFECQEEGDEGQPDDEAEVLQMAFLNLL